MAEADAILLLLKASHLTEQSENVHTIAWQIVNELCCFSLAVDQAGAFIEAGLCSIDNYLEQLSQHRIKLMNHLGGHPSMTVQPMKHGIYHLIK